MIEIVNLYNNDIKIKDIAAMYSVESGSIYSIINRRSWVHVTKDLYIKPHSQLKHKLTEEEAISILKEYKNGESISILQERYNVGYHAIHKLVSGVTWKNIDRSKI